MRWPLVAPLALVFVLALPSAPDARAGADTGWKIEGFRSEIAIQRDGTLLITETIDVDFAALEKHGIFREIPIEYSYDSEHHRIYQLEVVSVTNADGKSWHYTRSRHGANIQLKIGDPDQTVTGRQSYVITYGVAGVLNAFDDHDELYWNVNGPDWPVPTRGVSATVSLTGGGLERADCFQGSTGSDEACTKVVNDAGTAMLFASEGGFGPGEQMTIVAGIDKGQISPEPAPILVDKPENWWEKNFPPATGAISATIVLLIAGIGGFALLWWRHGRDRVYRSLNYLTQDPSEETRPMFARDQVVVEYTPPDELRPAQMGVILDERADTKDVTATIIDLAVRGYLTIEEKEKSWIFGKTDWHLTKKKETSGELLQYETEVFTGLFNATATEVDVSDLKNEFYKDLAEAQEKLYADAMKRKWFSRNPDTARDWAQGAGVVIAAAGGGLVWLLGLSGWAIAGVPVIVVGVLVFLGSSLMSKRTAAGSEALRRTLGFRLFIETAEKRRQEFNERANIFAEYLPYAIVFGSVDKWARAFRDIDTTPSTGSWYTGAAMFSAADFSRSLESFSSSVSSVIASTPGSSGGSGFSGGSSGGGGGGGGGGSW
ncbi:MAG: DUF2207 domain-containing protein [Chloroflexi bacterium]|nr:DUF2207 domain-containing protein [Chloroflexota bacterium]